MPDPETNRKEPPETDLEGEDFSKRPGTSLVIQGDTLTAKQAATLFLGVLTVIAVGWVLKALGHLIVPLLVAFFLSFLLWPLISYLIRRKVPGSVAVMAALLCVAATVGLFGLIISQSVKGFVAASPKYEQRLHSWADRVSGPLGSVAKELKKRENLEKVGGALANTALDAAGTVVSAVTTFALIIIYLLFILFGRLSSGDRVGRAFAPARAAKVRKALANVDRQVLRYLGMKTLINLATGFLFALTCVALGIDFPVLWGFAGFVISYVPTIGSIISPGPPILLALLQYPDELWRPLTLGIALVTIVVVMFNLVEPKVMGDSLGLSPLVVMFALLFFGWMWGIWGMVLSVPLAAIIKIICENFDSTKPVAIFME